MKKGLLSFYGWTRRIYYIIIIIIAVVVVCTPPPSQQTHILPFKCVDNNIREKTYNKPSRRLRYNFRVLKKKKKLNKNKK